jgi:dihydropteroate synthase
MIKAGAQIIDIGGESTRPFAETVDPDVEKERVVDVIT